VNLADLLSVADAAERLGVDQSRVRQLLRAGELAGAKVGRQWFVSRISFAERDAHRPLHGRPMSPGTAWAVIRQIEDDDPPPAPQRIRDAALRSLDSLARAVRRRALLEQYYIHPSEIRRVLADPAVVHGGIVAGEAAGAAINVAEPYDVYIPDSSLTNFVDRYAAMPERAGANVTAHVVADDAWPFARDQTVAGPLVAWLDLRERGDRAADEVRGVLRRPVHR